MAEQIQNFRFGRFLIEPEQHRITGPAGTISVEKRNMELLGYLITHRDRVVGADELLEELWKDRVVEESTIHRRISQLRKLLGDSAKDPQYIRTISKRGYQAIAETHEAHADQRVIKNRFKIEGEPIGEDEFGVVYRAIDLRQQEDRVANPYVAIKILKPEAIERSRDQGLTEVTSRSRQLIHPNLMNVFDFDRDGDTIFLTMPLLEGGVFAGYLSEHKTPLPLDECLAVISAVCDAIKFLHDNGTVHGCFAPCKVFYTSDKQVKVFDHGIPLQEANNMQGSGVFDPRLYASPAVLEGVEPTRADDIFSLGVFVWELLTGQHPFDYASSTDGQLDNLRTEHGNGLSDKTRKLLQQTMLRDPAQRPTDIAEIKETVLKENL